MRAARPRWFRSRSSLAGAVGAIALAGAAGAGLASCGAGGGLGLAIATVGVSAIFAGSSPGAYAVDPSFSRVTVNGAPSTFSAEDNIALSASGPATAIRYLVLGGAPFGGPGVLRLTFTWEAVALNPGDLRITVLGRDTDDGGFFEIETRDIPAASAGPTDVSFRLDDVDGGDLRLAAGDVLRIEFRSLVGDLSLLLGTAPAAAQVTVDVTDLRFRLDFAKDGQSLGVLSRRIGDGLSALVPIGAGSSLGFPYAFTGANSEVLQSSTYGAAPSTPPTAYSYRFPRPGEVAVQLTLNSTSTTTPATGTISAFLQPPGQSPISSLQVPFSVTDQLTTLSFSFDFGALAPSDMTFDAQVGTAGPSIPYVVTINVDQIGGDLEVQPGSHVLVNAPDVTGVFGTGITARTVTLSQPPRQ